MSLTVTPAALTDEERAAIIDAVREGRGVLKALNELGRRAEA